MDDIGLMKLRNAFANLQYEGSGRKCFHIEFFYIRKSRAAYFVETAGSLVFGIFYALLM